MTKESNMDLDMMGLDGNEFDDLFASDPGESTESEPVERVVEKQPLSFFHRLPVQLTLEVASTEITIEDLMTLSEGAAVQLNKLSDQPLDVKVNGVLIGSAEVVIVDGHYGLRMIELLDNTNWSQLA